LTKKEKSSLEIRPISITDANDYVAQFHRHNRAVQQMQSKFCVAAYKEDKLVGVGIAGRPVARMMDDGKTLEILRVCTDGTFNANSFIYTRLKRIGQLLGYMRIITYTLDTENQSSLKAINAKGPTIIKGHKDGWSSKKRERLKDIPVATQQKLRWEL